MKNILMGLAVICAALCVCAAPKTNAAKVSLAIDANDGISAQWREMRESKKATMKEFNDDKFGYALKLEQ